MVKKTRIDYNKRNRLTPIYVSDSTYNKTNKEYMLSFGKGFKMIKNSLSKDKSEKKVRSPAKSPKRNKHLKRNKNMLKKIDNYISDPSLSMNQQSNLIEIKRKIQLQLRDNSYDQKGLELYVETNISKILHLPNPF